jgi:DNA helicase II / ATP-dependent DNA helicase PcrA
VSDLLKDLNEVQQQAVRETDGPGLIIAGAGSGKTRVLTYRIAWLLGQGVPASNILALTFTNKAAAEMKERIGQLVGQGTTKYLWMGTFHSVFSKILRIESKHTGYSSNFSIYDTQDSRNVIRAIIKELGLDEQFYKPNAVFGRISFVRNNLITAGAYASNTNLIAEDTKAGRPKISEIFTLYRKRCHAADAMDFDDLLLNTNILFRDHPEVLAKYQDAFRYILVDEYQDTNYAQYLIVSKLAAKYKNISVVGDDAQSIYAFRGARIENILNFKKDYPGYKIFKLEQNYRSTKTIVNAANSLIAVNKGQIRKNIWSANETGEKLRVLECATDHEEGAVIARSISERITETGCGFDCFAILYRTNAQSRIFEEVLRRQNIPYKVYGSLSFYQRKEIKDLLAYCRLTVNKNDQEAFYRIINYPARGIGKTTTDRLANYCNANGLNPWGIVSNMEKYQPELGFNRGTSGRLSAFGKMITGFSELSLQSDAWETASRIANMSGILKDLFDPNSSENITKYENIQELLNGIKEFTDHQAEEGESTSLADFLQNVSLLTDADTEKPDDHNKVTLMTIHSAKGLEFKHVFIGGLEEELFPNHFAAASASELEEERRLFYVALTRAGSSATLTYSQTRYRWGVPAVCRPSRFLSEIDPKFLEHPDLKLQVTGSSRHKDGDFDTFSSEPGIKEPANYTSIKRRGGQLQKKHPAKSPVAPISRSKLIRMDQAEKRPDTLNSGNTGNSQAAGLMNNTDHTSGRYKDLTAGMLVEHERFGKGKVIKIEGHPPNAKATVDFMSHGQKQLLLKFAKLRLVKQ